MKTFLFTEKNPPKQITEIKTPGKTEFLWIDCQPEELSETLALIKQLTNDVLEERHLADCLNLSHPCFFDSMENYDFLIFHNLTFPAETGKLQTHPVSFVIFNKILLTVSQHDNAIEKMQAQILLPGRRQPTHLIILTLSILSAMIDNFLTLRSVLTNQLTQWQAKLLNQKKSFTQWDTLLNFKTNLRRLYIICEEQQDALDRWQQAINGNLPETIQVYFNDIANHILRVIDHIDIQENELDSLIELHYAIISKRTNEVMRILTVISGIFLPLTLITNIFGMNFENMIGLQNPIAFYITLTVMLLIAILMLIYFKLKKWI